MDKRLHSKKQQIEKEAGNSALYLLLSFLSGVLETGIFTAGLMQFNISIGLVLALAYQVGCLVRNPLRLSLKGAACVLCCSVPVLPYIHDSILVLVVVTSLVSSGVQSARECLLPTISPVSLSIKRIFRVSGFICGIIGGFMIELDLLSFVSLATCLTILPVALRQASKVSWTNLNRRFESDGYGWIMLLHQTHYFAYAYVLLAILLTHEDHSLGVHFLWKPVQASAWFALGWFSYISGQWLLKKKLKIGALHAALIGHAWVAICLFCMALFLEHHFILGFAWVFGGFGGGSVYAIKELSKANECRADIELWEHWGHIVGVSLSLLSVVIFPYRLFLPFVIAFVAALVTLSLIAYRNSCVCKR